MLVIQTGSWLHLSAHPLPIVLDNPVTFQCQPIKLTEVFRLLGLTAVVRALDEVLHMHSVEAELLVLGELVAVWHDETNSVEVVVGDTLSKLLMQYLLGAVD